MTFGRGVNEAEGFPGVQTAGNFDVTLAEDKLALVRADMISKNSCSRAFIAGRGARDGRIQTVADARHGLGVCLIEASDLSPPASLATALPWKPRQIASRPVSLPVACSLQTAPQRHVSPDRELAASIAG